MKHETSLTLDRMHKAACLYKEAGDLCKQALSDLWDIAKSRLDYETAAFWLDDAHKIEESAGMLIQGLTDRNERFFRLLYWNLYEEQEKAQEIFHRLGAALYPTRPDSRIALAIDSPDY